jgi:small subunit ribosomal protein S25e
MLSCLLLV